MLDKYLKMILNARVYDVAQETPLEYAGMLSARLKNQVWLKREDLQPVHSFKLRGAYNKISQLSDQACKNGIIAASAGNHAQGVALAARKRGVKATIVMPKTTPDIKVSSVRAYGARIILHGDTYDEACVHATQIAKERDMTFIHPYDDPAVIAGQGTIGMEILRQHEDHIDAVFVPVGGGGLIAGVAAYIKKVRPGVKVIGVEPEDAPCMYEALKRKRRIKLKQVGIFADGVAVRQAGKETYRIARECVDEIILVNTDEICAAIKDIFDDSRSIVEPAGALAVAGLKKYVQQRGVEGGNLVAINSGANVNFDRLRHVAERAELGERREGLFAVTIPERPGSFRKFCQTIGQRGITEFNYRYSGDAEAYVFAGVQLKDGDKEREAIVKSLQQQDYSVVDMTDNEMAKTHVRYMVGGKSPESLKDEVLYRFEFPERPGALLRFLTRIGKRWNISMFHYRNQGSAYGRVLIGIQVPGGKEKPLQEYLDSLGYRYWSESDNPAYQLFLG